MQLQRFCTAAHTSRTALAGGRLRCAALCQAAMRYTWYLKASSPSHQLDERTVRGRDSLLRKTWECPRSKAELQGESSPHRRAPWDIIQPWTVSRWKRLRKQGHALPPHSGSRTRAGVLWFCSWKERSGKLAWTSVCTRPWALSIAGSFCSCYANLKQLILLLVSWALHSLINFKREGKRMTMNICIWLSD